MIRFRINEVLDRKDWSGYRLAQESGLNQSVIWKIVGGKARRLDVDTLNALCAALGCQPGDLLEFVPDKKPAKPKSKT